jgi:hypothetical protein
MTVKVLSNDGALYEGKSYAEVVRMMKLDSFVHHPSKQEYMSETARRCVIFRGKEIRFNGPQGIPARTAADPGNPESVGVITPIFEKVKKNGV